jgi:acyl carrier protein
VTNNAIIAGEPSLLRRADVGLTTPWQEPQTETERKLAHIWQQVLGIDAIGASDDFFDIGGDSLAATVLAAEIEATFGIQFQFSDIINLSTVAKQALTVVRNTSSTTAQLPSWLIVGRAAGSQPPVVVVHGA